MTPKNRNNRFGPTRKIIGRREFRTVNHPPGSYSVELTLECGHKITRKGSQEPYVSAHCRKCGERLMGKVR